MGCCMCCMDEGAQVRQILAKVDVVRASEAVAGETKFIVGRIVLTQNPVIAPVSYQPCVYYKVVCEEYVSYEYQDSEGRSETRYRWDHLFTERKHADFLLADAAGQTVWVPAASCEMKVYVKAVSYGGEFSICNPSDSNPHLLALLERHGANGSNYFGNFDKPRLRYREGAFTVNEIIAILGTPSRSQINGTPVLVLNPAVTEAFDDNYFEKNEWNGTDRKCWAKLTEIPSLIATDDQTFFKEVNVDALPMSYECVGGLGAPVGPMQPSSQKGYPPQQQGYPPQQQGYPPQQQGYPPQQQGYYLPQQQGYPPQQQGYPPQQQGYPPQQQGYPPQQQGYPPQQQGYPLQQQGYPPQQQGYPPQQQGYPPQQQGYPPQQQGYPLQQQGYPLQQQGYPPQQQGC